MKTMTRVDQSTVSMNDHPVVPRQSDAQLLAVIRADLARSPFHGEGHRKVRAPAAPAPRPAGGGVPAPAARRAPSASAPRPDTPAGCRNSAPSPRRSSRSSSRPPHRQREALLRGPGPLAEQLDLHRQLPDVTLRRVEHLRHGLAVTIL